MGQGKTNKRKGSNAERYYANQFRELGFPFCKTSRQGSKLIDNAKIDLIFIPYNIQIKAGKQTALNVYREFKNMNQCLIESFPPEDEIHNKPQILIHYKEVGRGIKRQENHEIVYMTKSQWKLFYEDTNIVYDGVKVYKKEEEPNCMVFMSFNKFKEIVCHYLLQNKQI